MLPNISKITQLTPGIIRILGMNPSAATLQGTNSYLIGTSNATSRLLIDTSSEHQKEYIDTIIKYLNENKEIKKISDIIITHWHPDHIGAVNEVENTVLSLNLTKPVFHKFPSVSHPFKMKDLHNGQIFDLSEYGMTGKLQVLYTPGHSDDHICLFMTPQNILFSADIILGHGSTTFEDLTLYMESLRELERMQNSISMILPGHGMEIKEPISKIQEYLRHRLDRVKQVHDVLDNANSWQSEKDILKKVYSEEILKNHFLFMGALKNQNEALKYLLAQKKIEKREFKNNEEDKEPTLSNCMWRSKK